MARKVFFSFHYNRDAWRVAQIRNCNVIPGYDRNPFYDKAGWESIKRQGDQAIHNWIENHLNGTSVTVVLIGSETSTRRWVKYEIKRSVKLGKGLIGIDISKIRTETAILIQPATILSQQVTENTYGIKKKRKRV